MKLIIDNHSFQYETENLCKIFFPSVKIETSFNAPFEDGIYTGIAETENGFEITVAYDIDGTSRQRKAFAPKTVHPKELERVLAVTLYGMLEEITGFMTVGISSGRKSISAPKHSASTERSIKLRANAEGTLFATRDIASA